MSIAIRVENLSKQYRIGAAQPRYYSLRDDITRALATSFRALLSLVHRPLSFGDERRKTNNEWIWALRDISFEVQCGEVVGIIGRNGAGKSTLLKILSRITEPTEGYAEIHGRVGSLLEVGTGFHPELTGRENIYLNGGILGMTKAEIGHKLDEIVAFAEVEKFIDTPVKHYSSGMYVRLAFAVAAHLEPEILLVDEVLAVGDAAFQKKCLGKMGDVAKEGRTVLFVSHNMAAVGQLCSRGMLLAEGEIRGIGGAREIITKYLDDITPSGEDAEIVFPEKHGARAYFTRFCLRDPQGTKANRFTHSQPFVTEIEYVVQETIRADHLFWMVERADGVYVMGSGDDDFCHPADIVRTPGRYIATVRFPGGILNQGKYQYRVALGKLPGIFHDYQRGGYFEVFDDTDYGGNDTSAGTRDGVILLKLEWMDEKVEG